MGVKICMMIIRLLLLPNERDPHIPHQKQQSEFNQRNVIKIIALINSTPVHSLAKESRKSMRSVFRERETERNEKSMPIAI
jgi:hypothetical protein